MKISFYRKIIPHICYYIYNTNFIGIFSEIKRLNKKNKLSLKIYKQYKMNALFRNLRFIKLYSDIYSFGDLNFYPIVSKKDILNNIRELKCDKFIYSKRCTSGTTGSPFCFFKDKYALSYMDAMMHSVYSWHNIDIGDKQARIWGRALKPMSKVIQNTKDLLLNRKRLSAFEMDDTHCLHFYKQLLRFQPKFFYAYPNALYQFALFIERNHLDGNSLGAEVAICTGEVLFPHHRSKISEVFGCNVVNEYGSTENGIIAFECEHGNMHIMPTVHIEIENPDKEGFGNILVTELNSRSIPFVRYRIGDVGRLVYGDCDCNRPYEMLEIRHGRIDDYVRCPDGRLVYDAVFAYVFKEVAIQFKVIQDSINLLKIFIIPAKVFNAKIENNFRKLFVKYFGESMNIDFFIVDFIAVEGSGKYRYFISNL